MTKETSFILRIFSENTVRKDKQKSNREIMDSMVPSDG